MEKSNYVNENIHYAHVEINNINDKNLTIAIKHLDKFLEKCNDTKIQEIRDLLKTSEMYISEVRKKLDEIL